MANTYYCVVWPRSQFIAFLERSSPPFRKFSFAIPQFVDDKLNDYMNTLLLNQMLPMVPKCLMKGEEVGACKTTSAECDMRRRKQVTHLVSSKPRTRLEAALTLRSNQQSSHLFFTIEVHDYVKMFILHPT
jgi:hypothetical protein